MPRQYIRLPIDERFWPKVRKTDYCWEWAASCNLKGYGQIAITRGRPKTAHIVAWEMASGARVPKGGLILHVCDNPPCIRNDEPGVYVVDGVEYRRHGHLWLGTPAANSRDMVLKGRQAQGEARQRNIAALPRGERYWTPARVAMREMRRASSLPPSG